MIKATMVKGTLSLDYTGKGTELAIDTALMLYGITQVMDKECKADLEGASALEAILICLESILKGDIALKTVMLDGAEIKRQAGDTE